MTDYTLHLTEQQAGEVSLACEILARLRMGQIDMALRELPLDRPMDYEQEQYVSNYLRSLYRRDGKRLDDVSWDLHQVIRHRLAWDRAREYGLVNPDGSRNWNEMMGVIYDEPLPMGSEPLAKIEKWAKSYDMRPLSDYEIDEEGYYEEGDVQRLWSAWQAARAQSGQGTEPVAEVVSGYSGDPDTRGDKALKAINLSQCVVGDKLYRDHNGEHELIATLLPADPLSEDVGNEDAVCYWKPTGLTRPQPPKSKEG